MRYNVKVLEMFESRLLGKGNVEANHDEMGGRSEDILGTRIREVSTRGS